MAAKATRWGKKAKRGWIILRIAVLTVVLGAIGIVVSGCPPVVLYGPVPEYGVQPAYGVPAVYSIDR
ncbi:MAG: hypothetical protein WC655_10125 [Candidatus Hydrogenedentales bacterium]